MMQMTVEIDATTRFAVSFFERQRIQTVAMRFRFVRCYDTFVFTSRKQIIFLFKFLFFPVHFVLSIVSDKRNWILFPTSRFAEVFFNGKTHYILFIYFYILAVPLQWLLSRLVERIICFRSHFDELLFCVLIPIDECGSKWAKKVEYLERSYRWSINLKEKQMFMDLQVNFKAALLFHVNCFSFAFNWFVSSWNHEQMIIYDFRLLPFPRLYF